MPKFFSKANVSVEFRVCRAFLTTQQTQQQTGIIANFSAKTIIVNGKVETEVMSHNALMLTVNREGHLFVSSKYEQPPINSNGQSILGKKVFYFSLMPGSDKHEATLQVYDKFVNELADEVKEFVSMARSRSEEKKVTPRRMPDSVAGLIAMSPNKPVKLVNNDDIPF